jgi:DNA polymerase/3'-5' exonuclease PolX
MSARATSFYVAGPPGQAIRPKQKFPADLARAVAEDIRKSLERYCEPDRCVIAGSLRREKQQVGDIELLFVPQTGLLPDKGELFEGFGIPADLAAAAIKALCEMKVLEPRRNELGRITWGELIKLARHIPSGMPVDFFTATRANWWNYLVCRTGPAESNLAICNAARARGWKWEPYSSGFVDLTDPSRRAVMESERQVFEFAGLKYVKPKDR